MIRTILDKVYADGLRFIDGFCNSMDIKPTTGIVTGSRLIEVDSGNVEFRFDEVSKRWVPKQGGLKESNVGMALVGFAKVG